MGQYIKRIFNLNLPKGQSAFLWGPRQVGKSSWIAANLLDSPVVDLLKSDTFSEYASRPSLLRERYSEESSRLVVIDEVQKLPLLLDEVHWLIENKGISFLLTGSSARQLKRGKANMLGGRAWRRTMAPLCYPEVLYSNLEKVFSSGLLPSHFLSERPDEFHRAYISDYLKEEIAAEGVNRNLPIFSEFLRVAAITSSELLNYTNVGRECGVSAKVVKNYFQILEDTHLGYRISPWNKSKNRRMVETEKFYLFDVGLTNYLAKRTPKLKTPEFGKSFEQLVLMELVAYRAYKEPELEICFWRTSSKQEVDFILNDKSIAIEVKGGSQVRDHELKGLAILGEDGPIGRKVVVSLENEPRKVGDVEILPFSIFLEQLWGEELGI